MEQERKKRNMGKNVVLLLSVIILAFGIIISCGMYYVFSNTFILLQGTDVTLEVGTAYQEPGFVAYRMQKDVTDRVVTTTNLNTNQVGDYTIQYQIIVNAFQMKKMVTRNIHVVDTTKPNLKINSEKTVTIEVESSFQQPSFQAIDNYDGDITANVKVKSDLDIKKTGTYQIEYCVADAHHNETTDQIQVKVIPKKNAHIVVSISKQQLTYYEYGEVVLTSNVVTGIDGKTPKGTFKVLGKARDVILKGADYESFVSYWIAFKGNSFGFHDASWRSNFGGTIYKNHGSHGCVNMPYSKVKQLYNIVEIGTPVYIQS